MRVIELNEQDLQDMKQNNSYSQNCDLQNIGKEHNRRKRVTNINKWGEVSRVLTFCPFTILARYIP